MKIFNLKLLLVLLLLPLVYYFFFYKLDAMSFKHHDETKHALVTWTMYQTGDYFVPKAGKSLYFNKPPFKFWLTIPLIQIFGPENWVFRVVSACAATGTIVICFALGVQLFQSLTVGFLAALLMFTAKTFIFIKGARDGAADGLLIFLCSLSLYLFWQLREEMHRDSRNPKKCYYLSAAIGLIIGLGVLTKHIGGLMPYSVILPFMLFELFFSKTGKAWLLTGKKYFLTIVLLSITVPALYLVPIFLEYTKAIQTMVKHEIYKRAVQGFHHKNQVWFYFQDLFLNNSSIPPILLAAAILTALYFALRRHAPNWAFCLLWATLPVIGYSLGKSKLEWYISPAFPGMALIGAATLNVALRSFKEAKHKKHFFKLSFTTCFLLVATWQTYNQLIYNYRKLTPTFKQSIVEYYARKIVDLQKSGAGTLATYAFPKKSLTDRFYFALPKRVDLSGLRRTELIQRLADDKSIDFLILHSKIYKTLKPYLQTAKVIEFPPSPPRRIKMYLIDLRSANRL
ncbi:glycosyltransferase family 39 protein [bacterium]|nr:glycosyltransferase family 39 protein [bacterium]